MPFDSIVANPGVGGATFAFDTFTDTDAASRVMAYTAIAFGALNGPYTPITSSSGLPVAQQGTWTVAVSGTVTATISGTVTASISGAVDTELPAAAALADDAANPTTPTVGAALLVYDGATWDRGRGSSANGLLVDLGANNDVTVTSGSVAATQSGTWTVQPGNTANTTAWLVTGTGGTFPATQSGTWSVRCQDGSGNALTSAARGSERALSVQIVDASGAQITSFGGGGGGTQYTEDGASAGGESLTLAGAVRRDTAASSSGTDGDYSTLNTDSSGRLWVNASGAAVPVTDNGGSLTVDGTVAATQSGTWNIGTLTTITNVVHVDDNSSTLSIDDGGGSITVDGSITADTELPAAAALADATANPTTPLVGAALELFNGTTWDRARGDTTNGLDADITRIQSVVSTANSTSANLAGGATFTGTAEDVSHFAMTSVQVYSSHASAANGLSLQWSTDGTNWDFTTGYTISATTARWIASPRQARYFRLVYTNGGTLTTSLRIQTIHSTTTLAPPQVTDTELPTAAALTDTNANPTTALIGGATLAYNGTTWSRVSTPSNIADASAGNRSLSTGIVAYNGSTYDRVRGDSSNGLDVDVTRVSGTVTVDSELPAAAALADATANPTVPLVGAALELFNGTTWDRVRGDTTNGIDVDVTRVTGTVTVTAPTPQTSGGLTIYRNINAGTTGANIKASAGQVYGWYLFNAAASTRYVKLYNKASAPTVGTDTPVMTIPLPAGAAANVHMSSGIAFGTGIGIGATTGVADADTGAPSSNDVVVNILYA